MPGKMMVITPNGHVESRDLETPTYKVIRQALGGLLETVPYFDTFNGERCVAFVDEEGKIKGLESNPAANRLWWIAQEERGMVGKIEDHLVGPVVVLTGDEQFMEMV